MKKTTMITAVVLLALSARTAIVFDGNNSYSTYKGKASRIESKVEDPSENTIILLDRDVSQIDYTTVNTLKNRSEISDSKGMIIEAEGYYCVQNLKNRDRLAGISSCKERGAFLVKHLRESLVEYKIEVDTPGIYTFSIDAAYDGIDAPALKLYGVAEGEEPMLNEDPIGIWIGKYSTDDWRNIVRDYGGVDEQTPFFVDVEIQKHFERLVFLSSDPNMNLDRIRITRFKPFPGSDSEVEIKAAASDPSGNYCLVLAVLVLVSGVVLTSWILFKKKRQQ